MAQLNDTNYPPRNAVAGDAAIGWDAAQKTVGINIGTAGSADVTTSATDTTAGRVLKNGDHGLGSIVIRDEAAPNSVNVTSLFRISGSADSPIPGSFYTLHFNRISGAQAGQLIMQDGSSRLYYRSRDGVGVWSSWVELYHSGNYPSDTAWTTTTTLLNGWTGTVHYIKRAGMVTVIFDLLNATAKTSDSVITLPAGYRPGETVRSLIVDTTPTIGRCVISTAGVTSLIGLSTSNIGGAITYPVI